MIGEESMEATSFSDIPYELVINILLKLSVKSLKRFSLVNKRWYDLIQTSDFISKHYSSSDVKLLVKRQLSRTARNVISLFSDEDDECSYDLTIPFIDNETSTYIIGPCINGIICLQISTSSLFHIVLWNLATGEYHTLPQLDFSFPPDADIQTALHGMGFGWVPETDEYKVVVAIGFWKDSIFDIRLRPPVYVYTLSTNSWKPLNSEIPYELGSLSSDPPFYSQICVNGVCYWVNTITCTNIYKMYSFHLIEEAFGSLPLPDFETQSNLAITLSMLDGCIALIVRQFDPIIFLADIWVLEKDSWIKKFKIGPLLNIDVGLQIVKGKFYLQDLNWQLLSFNFNSHEVKNIDVRDIDLGGGGGIRTIQVLEYGESLVPIRRRL